MKRSHNAWQPQQDQERSDHFSKLFGKQLTLSNNSQLKEEDTMTSRTRKFGDTSDHSPTVTFQEIGLNKDGIHDVEELDEIVAKIKSLANKGKKLVDTKFKCNEKFARDLNNQLRWPKRDQPIKWVRPTSKDVTFFKKGGNPRDIIQNDVGNCYLMAVIACLTMILGLLNKTIVYAGNAQGHSDFGCYIVKMYLNGKWKLVIIDDRFPVYANTNTLVASQEHENNLFVCILEKAWAKVCGSYQNINGGLPSEVFTAFTGVPSMSYNTNTQDKSSLWEILKNAYDRKYPMACGTFSNHSHSDGVEAGHAYSILGIFEVGNNIKLLKLRNPWGQGEWNGRFSDKDYKSWTPALKKLLDYHEEEDGIFYMPYEDFLKDFRLIEICLYDPNISPLSFSVACKRGEPIPFDLTIRIKGTYVLTFHQENDKKFRGSTPEYYYSSGSITIEGIGFVNFLDDSSNLSGKCELEPGNYTGKVSLDLADGRQSIFGLNLYGPVPDIEQFFKN